MCLNAPCNPADRYCTALYMVQCPAQIYLYSYVQCCTRVLDGTVKLIRKRPCGQSISPNRIQLLEMGGAMTVTASSSAAKMKKIGMTPGAI